MRLIRFVFLIVVLGIGVSILAREPSNERSWALDQALLPRVEFADEAVTIRHIRNFTYRSVTDFTPNYYDRTIPISAIERVDYIVEPFGKAGAAHTFVTFGLADGTQLAVSVEIRREVGETFSAWRGLIRDFELMYVLADERDVIGLRAIHREHPVYLFPLALSPQQAQELFVLMMQRVESLAAQPEFYHTVVHNCTTNIIKLLNQLADIERIPWDYRFVLPERSAEVLERHGLLATTESITTTAERYRIDALVRQYIDEPDFSRRVRQTVSAAPAVDSVDISEVREVNDAGVLGEAAELVVVSAEPVLHRVTRVIDGDTIEVDYFGERRRVRYIGIDTPETVHPSRPVECFGTEAAARNHQLVANQLVRLERDITDTDKYNRLLRYVYVDEVFINERLVAEGYATVFTYPPDVRYTELFQAAEAAARAAERGLWGAGCTPATSTRPTTDTGEVCVIKGNISQTTGERIYHVPGCDYYDQTIITPTSGERWFCTEAEALAAGWRKALNCPV